MATASRTFGQAKVAVLGLGYSRITRDALPEGMSLGDEAVEASRVAIADAGLTPADIDGVTCFVEDQGDGPARVGKADGITMLTPQYLWRRLRLPIRWGEVNNKFVGSSLIEAHNAIAGGACQYALVVRGIDMPRNAPGAAGGSAGSSAPSGPPRATGDGQFALPYGATGGFMMHSQTAQRYFHKYGATREHMANFVSTNRKHALLNEKSYWSQNRPEQLTPEDYLSARMIADPLCLYDCDIPVRGVVAFVLGPAEAGVDLPHRASYIKATAQAWIGPRGPGVFFHQGGRLIKPALEDNEDLPPLFERDLWGPTGLRPSDMSTANVYDGFSILAWQWIEALGFCKIGEAFEFVQDGRIEITGELPLNTSGGHLGEGALGGAPHYAESILQTMGRAGARQVENVHYSLAATDRPCRAQIIMFSSERD